MTDPTAPVAPTTPTLVMGALRFDRGELEGFVENYANTIAQNEQRKTRRLGLPVLALGGEQSSGEGVGMTMKLVADDVQTVVLPGSGHWVAEQAPDDLLAAVTAFLAPYRDAAATVPTPRPPHAEDAATSRLQAPLS